jgi:hypothetical protein
MSVNIGTRFQARRLRNWVQFQTEATQYFSTTFSELWWSEFLATEPEVRVRFSVLPDFLRSSGYGTVSTQAREYSRGATWKNK